MTFELLDPLPRDDEVEPKIFDDCWRSSTVIVSSGDAGRANGQMKLLMDEKIKTLSVSVHIKNFLHKKFLKISYTWHDKWINVGIMVLYNSLELSSVN